MKITENAIYIRRKQKVYLSKGVGGVADPIVATFLQNLARLGYAFSPLLLERSRSLSHDQFLSFALPLLSALQQMLGDTDMYKPMYPDFPDQVMTMEESTLYFNALYHYYSLELPYQEQPSTRLPLKDQSDKKIIELGTKQEFLHTIQALISSKIPISKQDKEDIAWMIANRDDISSLLPNEIPLKENVGFVVGELLKHHKLPMEKVQPYFQTTTDVLRLATALSDGDVSLARNTRFHKFSRPKRRFLLSLLEQCDNKTEDMLRHKKKWIRLGEVLHPGEYQSRFPQTAKAFAILRNRIPIETFASKIESALSTQNISSLLDLLKKRPGEFARRLDHVLRLADNKEEVIERFEKVIDQLPSSLLLTLQTHFSNRYKPKTERIFFPKGDYTKYVIIPNDVPPLASSICHSIVRVCKNALLTKFAKLSPLSRVYVDPQLVDYKVPLSVRTASKSIRTVARGSKLPIPTGDTIRFFLWWKEGFVNGEDTGIVDIDLSASLYSDDWEYKEHISFFNLKLEDYKSVHSGDIVTASKGACEFIDIHIPSALKMGTRYVIMSIYCFSDHFFSSLPACFAGWMIRQQPDSGEIFEPSTVQNKVDLASDTTIGVPVVMDLIERKIYWSDMGLRRELEDEATVEKNNRNLAQLGKWITTINKPNLYDLFSLHAQSRGQQVDNRDEADTVFGVDKGITPFDMEIIGKEYVTK